jgi:hypothetical protein
MTHTRAIALALLCAASAAQAGQWIKIGDMRVWSDVDRGPFLWSTFADIPLANGSLTRADVRIFIHDCRAGRGVMEFRGPSNELFNRRFFMLEEDPIARIICNNGVPKG